MRIMEIVGIIRFSFVPSDPDGFKTSRGREGDEVAATILSEQRLAARFRLFETFTLPSLRAQRDADFRVIILASSLLPDHWRERLDALTGPVPQISVIYAKPQKLGSLIRRIVPPLANDEWRVTFRLDDDDGLTDKFVGWLREIARPEYAGMCVSLPRSVHIEDGDPPRVYGAWVAKHGVGLAYIGHPGDTRTIYHCGGHGKVDEHRLTIIDSREYSCVRLFHAFNDHPYAPTTERKKRPVRKEYFERKFGDGFGYVFDPSAGHDWDTPLIAADEAARGIARNSR